MLLAGVSAGLGIITIPWLAFTSKIDMNRDIVTKTYNAENALYNYHWFQEKAGEIKTAEQNIEVSENALKEFISFSGDRKDWTFEDKNEYSRLSQIGMGSKNYYNGLVNDYNARAKEVDRNIFQDNLPLFFNLK